MKLSEIDVPTIVLFVGAILGSGGIGAVLNSWVQNRPKIQRNRIDQAAAAAAVEETATEAWRKIAQEARAELEAAKAERLATRAEADNVRSSYYGLLGLFVQFRNHVHTEVSDIGVLIDRKEVESAQERLEALGRHVSGLRLPTEGT